MLKHFVNISSKAFVNKSVRHLVCLSEFDSPWCDMYTAILMVVSSNFSRHVSKYKVSCNWKTKTYKTHVCHEFFLLFFLLNQFPLYVRCSFVTDYKIINSFCWMSLGSLNAFDTNWQWQRLETHFAVNYLRELKIYLMQSTWLKIYLF